MPFPATPHHPEPPIFKGLDERRDAETGPFSRSGGVDYRVFNYMHVATNLHHTCHAFRQEGSLEIVIEWLKKRCTSWDPTKKILTKQITLPDGSRPRAYMLPPSGEPANEYHINNLRSATNTQLGLQFDMKAAFDPTKKTQKKKKSHY